MNLDEEIDADEFLRDIGEKVPKSKDDGGNEPEDVREVNFETRDDENENFKEIADEFEDLQ